MGHNFVDKFSLHLPWSIQQKKLSHPIYSSKHVVGWITASIKKIWAATSHPTSRFSQIDSYTRVKHMVDLHMLSANFRTSSTFCYSITSFLFFVRSWGQKHCPFKESIQLRVTVYTTGANFKNFKGVLL
jgi:hypothetical protein